MLLKAIVKETYHNIPEKIGSKTEGISFPSAIMKYHVTE